MSAGAPRRRTLMRPAAQNLSLSLVEHPSFKFRTFGAYDSVFSPPASNDEDSGKSGDTPPSLFFARGPLNPMSATLSPRGPPSTRKPGIPLTAASIDSVYSQDSWNGKPSPNVNLGAGADADCGPDQAKRSASHVRVDTRRFGVAFSPSAKFVLPFASASARKSTFVLDLLNLVTAEAGKPSPQTPSSRPAEYIRHAIPNVISKTPNEPEVVSPLTRRIDEILLAMVPQPLALPPPAPPTHDLDHEPPPATPKAPRSAKSAKVTLDRTSLETLRSPAQGLSRFLSRVSLPTKRASRDKRQTVKQVPPPKRRTVQPVPPMPSLPGCESVVVFDLKDCEADEEVSNDATAGLTSVRPCQTTISETPGFRKPPVQLQPASLLGVPQPLPSISISPLQVNFGGSMD